MIRGGLLIAVLLAAGGCATRAPLSAAFREADADGDGRVNRTELAAAAGRAEFERLDRDGDLEISREEWFSGDQSPDQAVHFAALDRDGNGKISAAEFTAAAAEHAAGLFRGLDKNEDGALTADEYAGRPPFSVLSLRF